MLATTCQRGISAAMVIAATMASASCGEVVRSGRAPVLVIVDSVEAASGAEPQTFGNVLFSDVETLVTQTVGGQTVRVPTIFSDPGRVTFRLTLKNPGVPSAPVGPTTLNDVTMNRYRVTFRRADGRNTPGVDVPYGFDGAFTVTLQGINAASAGFEIVRHQMKQEPPLRNLRGGGNANLISTIAEITFFGRDVVGNEVMAQAALTVNFGDFGDPQ